MIRWNGWGHQHVTKELPESAITLLNELCGPGNPRPDIPLELITKDLPPSRIHVEHKAIVTDAKTRFQYSHGQSFQDWVTMRSGGKVLVSDGVALPETEESLKEVLALAKKHDWVVIPHGGGSSVVGHLTPLESKRSILTISMSRLNRLCDLNETDHTATFQAGVLGPDLEAQLQNRGFTLGHFPQSFEFSSLGGWIVTRSSGQQSRYFGRMDENFIGGTVLMDDGILEIPNIPASSAGPDLRHLIAGSEGRMGILSEATIRIVKKPESDRVLAFFLPDFSKALNASRELAQQKTSMSMLRLSNSVETMTHLAMAGKERLIGLLKKYLSFRGQDPSKTCLCLIGITGDRKRVNVDKKLIKKMMHKHGAVYVGHAFEKTFKANRFYSAYARNTLWDLGYGVDTLETALPWNKIHEAIDEVEGAIRSACTSKVHVFTHLSHVYETGSSMYTSYIFPLEKSPEETMRKWKAIKAAASEAIVQMGGTISHQHGVGTDHAPYLVEEKDHAGMNLIRAVLKEADPHSRFNPGKLLLQNQSLQSGSSKSMKETTGQERIS